MGTLFSGFYFLAQDVHVFKDKIVWSVQLELTYQKKKKSVQLEVLLIKKTQIHPSLNGRKNFIL